MLHVALRNRSNAPILVDGKEDVQPPRVQMQTFSEAIIPVSGEYYTGKAVH
ncbi:hypothetical protein ACLK17_25870 [Escherichia coli]